MKKFVIGLFMMGLLVSVSSSYAQNRNQSPFREYVNPEEMVTFDKSASFEEAIVILNQFAQDFAGKFIVDKSNFTGTIGLNLPAMHWRDALDFILNFRRLELIEYETFFEIVVPALPPASQARPAGAAAGGAQIAGDALATTRTREVRISATFFEGNKRALQEIGVDWSTLTKKTPLDIGDLVGDEAQETLPQTGLNDYFVSVNTKGAQNVSQNVFNSVINFGDIGGGVSVQALFSAFEADNIGEIIATPFTKVVDGREGRIQVGQDFSIKQRDFAGNVTDQFFSTGTILTVTPTIVMQGDTSFVFLDIKVERSSAIPDPVSTIINKQEAQTSSLMVDGETAVIAGLYRTDETRVRRGVPLLKDIPILGYLFGFNSVDIAENELIILVQAEIVESIPERYGAERKSKAELLSSAKERNRNDMDYTPPVEKILPPRAEPPVSEAAVEIPEKEAEAVENDTTRDDQGLMQQARDLSVNIKNPELMVVLPNAFDLEKYMEYKAKGLPMEDTSNGLDYFVIGGSFVVKNNAFRFQKMLQEQGYSTRILANTGSRFYYVAYEGYADLEKAILEVKEMRSSVNEEAWLFIKSDATSRVNGN